MGWREARLHEQMPRNKTKRREEQVWRDRLGATAQKTVKAKTETHYSTILQVKENQPQPLSFKASEQHEQSYNFDDI